MLSKLETYLTEKNVFNYDTPAIIKALIDTIPNNIPYKMKLLLVLNEVILFTSQFRINIKHWNGSSIPVNVINFLLAESGASKDSSLKTVRKNFKKGYDIINEKRLEIAERLAKTKATEAGEENPENYHVYKDYYIAPNPLFVAPSTTEGFIQHLNDIDSLGIGAGYLSTSELGAELSSNANLVDNIKLIAELYDEGNKEVKVLKDRTAQTKEIKNLPVSALFMGSQDNILFDENTKKKFKTEFTTKLGRRSNLVFIKEKVEPIQYLSIDALLESEKEKENYSLEQREKINDYIENVTNFLLDYRNTHLSIDDDVRDLIILYQKYNELQAVNIDNLLPMTKLTKQHLHWKALKLAGALALIRKRLNINIKDYSYAITFVESIFNDINLFEQELTKENYEVFVSYVHTYCINGKLKLSLHDLKKKGFIASKGDNLKKLEELVTLASVYDNKGLYEIEDNTNIVFTELNSSEYIGISYHYNDGTKEQRKKSCDKDYKYKDDITFEDLVKILNKNYDYSPFKFNNGLRSNDNIISGTKWIALDIDKSPFTDEEMHLMLEDLKHIIVRTSDNSNAYKYRVLLEFDCIVDLPSSVWKRFLESIKNELAIEIDLLPKAQIFFSYADRNIITNFDGELFKVKHHIEYALNKDINTNKNNTTCDLKNPLETFFYAFNAKQGEGSRMIYKAAKHAKDLGASKQQVLELVHSINNYWIYPMDKNRFENTIIKQIENWSF